MKKQAFINGRVLDPQSGALNTVNLLLVNGKIVGHGYLPDEEQDVEVIDLNGYLIIPDVLDSFVYLSEPGHEAREGLTDLNAAALQGGITALAGTPLQQPKLDTPEAVVALGQKMQGLVAMPFYPIGAISKESAGKQLAEMGLMSEAGVVALTDGNSCDNASLMRNALQYSTMFNLPLLVNPQETSLSTGGDMHEGYYSTVLGLKGIPACAEEIRLTRDIALLEQYGGRLHFFPVSTAAGLQLIIQAKARGLAITCGTAPHYLYFTDRDLSSYDTNLKVSPPFRTDADRTALIEGIKSGAIDVLASHHTPCLIDEKRTEFNNALPGISGLDLFLPALVNVLYHQKKVPLAQIIKSVSVRPHQLLKRKCFGLSLGSSPNFTVLDLNQEWTVTKDDLKSLGKNTPLLGHKLKSRVILVVINGQICRSELPA